MVWWACLVYGFMWFYFSRVYARRGRGEEDARILGMTDEVAELGDSSPRLMYTEKANMFSLMEYLIVGEE